MGRIAWLVLLLCTVIHRAVAQDEAPFPDFLEEVQGILNEDTRTAAAKALASVLSERYRFLDINYQEPDDSDGNSGWNVKYDLRYVYVAGDGFNTEGGVAQLSTLEAKLDITGSYSFGSAANNENLSSVKGSFAYVGGEFGTVPYADSNRDRALQHSLAYQQCKGKLVTPHPDDQGAIDAYEQASLDCISEAAVEGLFEAKGPAYAYELAIIAGVEGDQDYSETHDVYGVSGIISARHWPSLRVEFEQVDASDNEQRAEITDDDSYERVTVEVGYQYSIDAVKNLPITVSLGYRNFYELSASREIKDADLDEFDHWSVSLRVPARMFSFIESEDYSLYVRYTDGQLPFDIDSDSAFELGFSSNIALLARLFE